MSETRARRAGRLDVKDRYIVVLKDGGGDPLRATRAIAADAKGVVPSHVYRHLFPGFAAEIPRGKLKTLRNDPRVRAIVPDGLVSATAELPTGVDRIGGDENATADLDGTDERVDADVAVLDTAGDDTHPDLNVWTFANRTDAADGDDVGHGTHVGGTIGALDDGEGVVGVAPGARLWNIRVLRRDPVTGNGTGTLAWIVCGLDVIERYATDQGDGLGAIEVANASLGGRINDATPCPTASSPLHQAFCDVGAAGITVVVSAGNDHLDAAGAVPAAYDEAITVAALADSDGQPGGTGPNTSRGPDDTFADFSNFGADVDLAAPGVDINSTIPGGYDVFSGTSMASPHVAGAAALYLAAHPSAPPAEVKVVLRAGREQFAMPNDPDPTAEGIVNVVDPTDYVAPTVAIDAPSDGQKVRKGVAIEVNAGDYSSGVAAVEVRYCKGTTCDFADGKPVCSDSADPYQIVWQRQPKKNGNYTLVAQATDEAGNQTTSDPVLVKVANKKKNGNRGRNGSR